MTKFLKGTAIALVLVGILFLFLNQRNKTEEEAGVNEDSQFQVQKDNLIDKSESSLVSINQKLQTDPNNLDLILNKIKILLSRGTATFNERENADEAFPLIAEYLEKGGDKVTAKQMEGYAYEIKRDYLKAIETYTNAISMVDLTNRATLASLYAQRGHASELKGDLEQAEADYEEAYGLDPSNIDAIHDRARSKFRKEEYEEAKRLLQTILAQSKDSRIRSEAFIALSGIETHLGNIEEAIGHANKAIKQDGSLPLGYATRARLAVMYEQDYNQAILLTEKALSIYPKQVAAHEWRGITQLEQEDFAAAEESFKVAIEFVPQDITLMPHEQKSVNGRLYYYLAIAQALQDKDEESIDNLNKSLDGLSQDTFLRMTEMVMRGKDGSFANLMDVPEFATLSRALAEKVQNN